MGVFLTKLVGKLTMEDANWRAKTIIVQDNAPYKKEFGVLEQLARQGCNNIFLGPYSFSAAPCELLFAALKRGNLNPEHLPTGKKYVFTSYHLYVGTLQILSKSWWTDFQKSQKLK